MRKLLKAVPWVLGTVAALVLALFAINSFDQDLRPETTALLQPENSPYAPAENLYFALVGFTAPEGEDIFAVGEARIADSKLETATLLRNPERFAESAERARNRDKTSFQGKIDFCRQVTGSCWTGADGHRADIDRLLMANQELYRRYLALHQLRGYFETQPPGYLIAPVYVPGEVRALFLADTALRLEAGAAPVRKAALDDLGDDFATWQRMLAGNGGLISKMLATISLHGDYILLGDLVADPRVDVAPLAAEIEQILTRPTPDDWKLHHVFANEFRFASTFFEQTRNAKSDIFLPSPLVSDNKPEWWERQWARIQGHFFKPNATQNASARSMIELQKMAETEPQDLLAARQRFRQWTEDNVGLGVSAVYNPLGKVLVAIALPSYDDYVLRVYDVAAYARAVRLGYEIRKAAVADGDIPAFIVQHREWATHPVSGESFAWDPGAREIQVRPSAKGSTARRYNVPVWPHAAG